MRDFLFMEHITFRLHNFRPVSAQLAHQSFFWSRADGICVESVFRGYVFLVFNPLDRRFAGRTVCTNSRLMPYFRLVQT